jgi:hypothetical protein
MKHIKLFENWVNESISFETLTADMQNVDDRDLLDLMRTIENEDVDFYIFYVNVDNPRYAKLDQSMAVSLLRELDSSHKEKLALFTSVELDPALNDMATGVFCVKDHWNAMLTDRFDECFSLK